MRGEGAGSTDTRYAMGVGDDKFYMAYDDVDNRHNIVVQGSGIVSIPNGVELASGTDGTAANTLDDYEEGTFTATMQDGNGSNVVLTSQDNNYTKIGRLVFVTGNITLNDTGKSGEIVLTNLPFNGIGASQLACGHFWVDRAGPTLDTIGGTIYKTASTASAYFVNPTGGASGGGNASSRYFQFSNWANGRYIYFSITYQV